jgi:uncharacterized protein (UPF0179 family)
MMTKSEKAYIGTKVVVATPMTKCAFAVEHNKPCSLPDGLGYRVTYPDGYVSWCPKAVFEGAYREVSIQEYELIGEGESR